MSWYKDAVTFIAARNITSGTGNGNFGPSHALSRGQFVVMLMKAYGIAPDTDKTLNFDDAGDTWYTGYLAAAKRMGLSSGVGSNRFAPEKEIARQEMFTLLYNTLKMLDKLPAAASNKRLQEHSDSKLVQTYAQIGMEHFLRANILFGSQGMLFPDEKASRAQFAIVLHRLLNMTVEK